MSAPSWEYGQRKCANCGQPWNDHAAAPNPYCPQRGTRWAEPPAPSEPAPLTCCKYDHNNDGNCHIHSAPGVLRNSALPPAPRAEPSAAPHAGHKEPTHDGIYPSGAEQTAVRGAGLAEEFEKKVDDLLDAHVVEPAFEGDGAYPVTPMCECPENQPNPARVQRLRGGRNA